MRNRNFAAVYVLIFIIAFLLLYFVGTIEAIVFFIILLPLARYYSNRNSPKYAGETAGTVVKQSMKNLAILLGIVFGAVIIVTVALYAIGVFSPSGTTVSSQNTIPPGTNIVFVPEYSLDGFNSNFTVGSPICNSTGLYFTLYSYYAENYTLISAVINNQTGLSSTGAYKFNTTALNPGTYPELAFLGATCANKSGNYTVNITINYRPTNISGNESLHTSGEVSVYYTRMMMVASGSIEGFDTPRQYSLGPNHPGVCNATGLYINIGYAPQANNNNNITLLSAEITNQTGLTSSGHYEFIPSVIRSGNGARLNFLGADCFGKYPNYTADISINYTYTNSSGILQINGTMILSHSLAPLI